LDISEFLVNKERKRGKERQKRKIEIVVLWVRLREVWHIVTRSLFHHDESRMFFRNVNRIYHRILVTDEYALEGIWKEEAVTIATGYGLDDRGVGVRAPVVSSIFSCPCPHCLWGPPIFLSNGCRG
jgi:hypothetical protein